MKELLWLLRCLAGFYFAETLRPGLAEHIPAVRSHEDTYSSLALQMKGISVSCCCCASWANQQGVFMWAAEGREAGSWVDPRGERRREGGSRYARETVQLPLWTFKIRLREAVTRVGMRILSVNLLRPVWRLIICNSQNNVWCCRDFRKLSCFTNICTTALSEGTEAYFYSALNFLLLQKRPS